MKHLLILFTLSCLYSCTSNDYLVDGGVANPNVGMSTYDFLKSNKQLDSLAILIKKADMIDVVNTKSTTLFAPNNLSIKRYIFLMREFLSNPSYSINDIPQTELKTMLGGYIFNQTLDRSKLFKQGKVYTTYNGEERLLSLEPRKDYVDQLDNYPEYVYYTFKVGEKWDPVDKIENNSAEADIKTVVRTSNIMSTNGVIHVLQGYHIFSNYKKP